MMPNGTIHMLEVCDFATSLGQVHSTGLVSEYDQETPQSQTADNPVAPRGRAAQSSQNTRKTN